MNVSLSFDEVEIQKLFGHEAAEDEDIARLKEYYFKTSTYDQVVNDLPLRILVGHKGIGKSALIQVAMSEDYDANRLSILIKPDDVTGLAADTSDFLKTIRDWKRGLTEIIAKKVMTRLCAQEHEDIGEKLKRFGGKAIDFLKNTLKEYTKLDFDPTCNLLISA